MEIPVPFLEKWLPTKDLKRLVLSRGLRSFSQGYIIVIFAIYLSQIGFSAWLIGITLGIGSAASAVLTLVTGVLSDRVGRKPFLLAYSILLAISGVIFSITTLPLVLIFISALGGIGRSGGAGGQAGPFAPAETALISEKTNITNRPKVFTINSIVGTFSTSLGAFFAAAPEAIRVTFHLSLVNSYKPFFMGISLIGILTLIILIPITENPKDKKEKTIEESEKRSFNYKRIWKIATAGVLNGFGLGFISGILPYWLYLRFGASPAEIGPVIGLSLLLTSFSSVWVVYLARCFGDVNIISASRILGAFFTLSLAFAPTYPIAATFVILRMASSLSAMPIRQSYTMGIIDPDMRGTAAGISGVARRLPAAISPAISGFWLNLGSLDLPFFAGSFFMAANAVLYFLWFRNIKPKDDQSHIL